MRSAAPRFLLGAMLGLGVLTGAASADAKVLATGLMLSSNADLIDCFVSNISDEVVPVALAKVYSYQGAQLAGSDTCSGTNLAAGKTCTVSVPAQAGRFVVRFTAADRAIRAQCQFTSDQNDILATMEAR